MSDASDQALSLDEIESRIAHLASLRRNRDSASLRAFLKEMPWLLRVSGELLVQARCVQGVQRLVEDTERLMEEFNKLSEENARMRLQLQKAIPVLTLMGKGGYKFASDVGVGPEPEKRA